eukprot:2867080-Rhodomonas_salina.3
MPYARSKTSAQGRTLPGTSSYGYATGTRIPPDLVFVKLFLGTTCGTSFRLLCGFYWMNHRIPPSVRTVRGTAY